jgi:hypothetical protein
LFKLYFEFFYTTSKADATVDIEETTQFAQATQAVVQEGLPVASQEQSVVQEALEDLEEKPVLIVPETLETVQETRPGTTGEKLVNQEAAPAAEGVPLVDQETAPVVEVPRVIEETTPAVEIQSPGEKEKSD